MASRDLDPSEIRPLLDDPDLPFGQPGDDLLKNSRTTTVAETTMLVRGSRRGDLQAVQSQEMARPALSTLFRPSRAWRSWQAGQDLASRGIPTPQNLAFLSRRRSFKSDPLFWFLPHETYLVTVKEAGRAEPGRLRQRGAAGACLPDAPGQDSQPDRLARRMLIRSLHDRSLSHRDLKASNI